MRLEDLTGRAVYPEYQVDPSDSPAELTFISAANRNDIRNWSPCAFTFGVAADLRSFARTPWNSHAAEVLHLFNKLESFWFFL